MLGGGGKRVISSPPFRWFDPVASERRRASSADDTLLAFWWLHLQGGYRGDGPGRTKFPCLISVETTWVIAAGVSRTKFVSYNFSFYANRLGT
jgi:hypothetical protein